MNSRVSWSVEGIDPSVRERAEAAARRAGLSLGDWLNATIGEAPPNFLRPSDPRSPLAAQDARNVAEIHQRLDSITSQIEQISRPAPRNEPPAVARELNDAISRLDARLSQISNPLARPPQLQLQSHASPAPALQSQAQPQKPEAPPKSAAAKSDPVERVASSQVYRASPSITPGSLDSAIAEIAARQSELDRTPSRTPPRSTPPIPAAAPAAAAAPALADFAGLEQQLLKITGQIEALQRPDGIEQSIAGFRGELAEIRNVITEAMPRRAIQSMEREIRLLSRRIDETRQSGIDGQALASVERALGEIRDKLSSLTPAEQLAGFDDAIRNLGGKLDLIVRSSNDPAILRQLEEAIAALRAIVSHAASNDTLTQLNDDLRGLSSKVDQLAQSGSDSFAALEQRISVLTSTLENRERPAISEGSVQLEGALRALSDRLDHLPPSQDNSPAFAHLEGAVRALSDRFDQLSSGHDNSPAFARLEGAVRALSDRFDQMPAGHDNSPAFAHLEGAVRALSDRLDRLPVSDPSSGFANLEGAIRALSDRLDHLPVGNDSSSVLAHLEQRVSYLLERLEASGPRGGDLGQVEQGLQDILRHLERQQSSFATLTETSRGAVAPVDGGLVDTIKRELSDIRFSQSETDRHTQDSLEVVHNTLGHVVDRLAIIEGDLRTVRSPPMAPRAATPLAMPLQPPTSPPPPPELPNPAAAQFVAAPRQFGSHAADPVAAVAPKTVSEILDPKGILEARAESRLQPTRVAIAPELPPDHPLEPGTRPHGRIASPSERIAASEHAISEIASGAPEPASASSFIAAARRAALAAAAAPANDKSGRGKKSGKSNADPAAKPSPTSSKIRSMLLGVGIVVFVLGTFKVAMMLLDGGSQPVKESSTEASPPPPQPADREDKPAVPAPALPSMTSPTPIGRQSLMAPKVIVAPSSDSASTAAPPSPAPAASSSEVTSALTATPATVPLVPPAGDHKLTLVPIPASEKLPDAIGGPALRSAALKGDASAAYEIGVRYAEGKGVAVNYDEAAKWYVRAAQAGVVPAVFRLGTFYEKGLSVKKDLDAARRYYVQAADRGNAKAMHNLAVLDADGGAQGANYKSASQWFRKAAERGVADSQFNLGILYARGIGVEQNLAESFKWFSLAAAQGDVDAGHKRDDVAKRLDPQSLAAAKLAIQTFTPESQPDDAVNVASPPGGWDSVQAAATAAKPAARLAVMKRASR